MEEENELFYTTFNRKTIVGLSPPTEKLEDWNNDFVLSSTSASPTSTSSNSSLNINCSLTGIRNTLRKKMSPRLQHLPVVPNFTTTNSFVLKRNKQQPVQSSDDEEVESLICGKNRHSSGNVEHSKKDFPYDLFSKNEASKSSLLDGDDDSEDEDWDEELGIDAFSSSDSLKNSKTDNNNMDPKNRSSNNFRHLVSGLRQLVLNPTNDALADALPKRSSGKQNLMRRKRLSSSCCLLQSAVALGSTFQMKIVRYPKPSENYMIENPISMNEKQFENWLGSIVSSRSSSFINWGREGKSKRSDNQLAKVDSTDSLEFLMNQMWIAFYNKDATKCKELFDGYLNTSSKINHMPTKKTQDGWNRSLGKYITTGFQVIEMSFCIGEFGISIYNKLRLLWMNNISFNNMVNILKLLELRYVAHNLESLVIDSKEYIWLNYSNNNKSTTSILLEEYVSLFFSIFENIKKSSTSSDNCDHLLCDLDRKGASSSSAICNNNWCLCTVILFDIELLKAGISPISGIKSQYRLAYITEALEDDSWENSDRYESSERYESDIYEADDAYPSDVDLVFDNMDDEGANSRRSSSNLNLLAIYHDCPYRYHVLKGLYEHHLKHSYDCCHLIKCFCAFCLSCCHALNQEFEQAEKSSFESIYWLHQSCAWPSPNHFIIASMKGTLLLENFSKLLVKRKKYMYGILGYEAAIQSYKLRERHDHKKLHRVLAGVCLREKDFKRALTYHLKILSTAQQDSNINEFVYISQEISKIALEQGKFRIAEEYLEVALGFIRDFYPKLPPSFHINKIVKLYAQQQQAYNKKVSGAHCDRQNGKRNSNLVCTVSLESILMHDLNLHLSLRKIYLSQGKLEESIHLVEYLIHQYFQEMGNLINQGSNRLMIFHQNKSKKDHLHLRLLLAKDLKRERNYIKSQQILDFLQSEANEICCVLVQSNDVSILKNHKSCELKWVMDLLLSFDYLKLQVTCNFTSGKSNVACHWLCLALVKYQKNLYHMACLNVLCGRLLQVGLRNTKNTNCNIKEPLIFTISRSVRWIIDMFFSDDEYKTFNYLIKHFETISSQSSNRITKEVARFYSLAYEYYDAVDDITHQIKTLNYLIKLDLQHSQESSPAGISTLLQNVDEHSAGQSSQPILVLIERSLALCGEICNPIVLLDTLALAAKVYCYLVLKSPYEKKDMEYLKEIWQEAVQLLCILQPFDNDDIRMKSVFFLEAITSNLLNISLVALDSEFVDAVYSENIHQLARRWRFFKYRISIYQKQRRWYNKYTSVLEQNSDNDGGKRKKQSKRKKKHRYSSSMGEVLTSWLPSSPKKKRSFLWRSFSKKSSIPAAQCRPSPCSVTIRKNAATCLDATSNNNSSHNLSKEDIDDGLTRRRSLSAPHQLDMDKIERKKVEVKPTISSLNNFCIGGDDREYGSSTASIRSHWHKESLKEMAFRQFLIKADFKFPEKYPQILNKSKTCATNICSTKTTRRFYFFNFLKKSYTQRKLSVSSYRMSNLQVIHSLMDNIDGAKSCQCNENAAAILVDHFSLDFVELKDTLYLIYCNRKKENVNSEGLSNIVEMKKFSLSLFDETFITSIHHSMVGVVNEVINTMSKSEEDFLITESLFLLGGKQLLKILSCCLLEIPVLIVGSDTDTILVLFWSILSLLQSLFPNQQHSGFYIPLLSISSSEMCLKLLSYFAGPKQSPVIMGISDELWMECKYQLALQSSHSSQCDSNNFLNMSYCVLDVSKLRSTPSVGTISPVMRAAINESTSMCEIYFPMKYCKANIKLPGRTEVLQAVSTAECQLRKKSISPNCPSLGEEYFRHGIREVLIACLQKKIEKIIKFIVSEKRVPKEYRYFAISFAETKIWNDFSKSCHEDKILKNIAL